jgi:hypothetical protein
MSDKKEWPEVVGLSGQEAEERVKNDDPTVQTQVLDQNAPCTRDFRMNRVRIFINGEGVVVKAPRRG